MTKKFETLGDIVRAIEQGESNPHAFNLWKKGHWYSTSSHEFLYNLKRLVHGLIGLGMESGDKVGILSSPSAHWLVADLAIIIAGGVSVPLFEKISDDNFVYEVAQANLRHIFVQGVEQWKRYERHHHLFDLAIGLDHEPEPDGARSFHEVLKEGEVHWEKHPDLFDQLLDRLKPEDLATIVYTSGSMGVPKGAEMTNRALVHLVNQDVFKWEPNEKYLSILPLAHIFARQIIYIMLGWNVSIYFLNDLGEFTKVCREQKPHLMIVVPRLLEKVYDGMLSQVKKQTGWKKRLGEWAFSLACKNKLNPFERYLVFPILDLLVYQYLRSSLGGNWRVILCGGAKLDPKLYRFFLRIGFPVYEGWGLTEASTVCVNQPGKIKVGTVGLPLPGARVELGEGGEILVHGPTVMRGYYRHPRATKLAIDSNGWLHTGDKGEIDSEGYLTRLLTSRLGSKLK